MAHPGLTNLSQNAAMLGHGVRAVPACQQHAIDPFKRFRHRSVIVEIALYYLDTIWRRESRRISYKSANRLAGSNKGTQC